MRLFLPVFLPVVVLAGGCSDQRAPSPIAGGPGADTTVDSYAAAEAPPERPFVRLAKYRGLSDGVGFGEEPPHAGLDEPPDGVLEAGDEEAEEEYDDGEEYLDEDELDEEFEDEYEDEYLEDDELEEEDEVLGRLKPVARGKFAVDFEGNLGAFVDAGVGLTLHLPGKYWSHLGVGVGPKRKPPFTSYAAEFKAQDKNILARIDLAWSDDVIDFTDSAEASRRVARFIGSMKTRLAASGSGWTLAAHTSAPGTCAGVAAMLVDTAYDGTGVYTAIFYKDGRKVLLQVYGKDALYASELRELRAAMCGSLKLTAGPG